MKSFLLAGLLALGLISGSASAAPEPFKTVLDLDNGAFHTQAVGANTTFSDYYGVQLDSFSDVVAGVQNNTLRVGRLTWLNITGLQFSLFNSVGTAVTGLSTASDNGYLELSGLLSAGKYFLNVAGQTTGTKGGSYTVAFDAVAAPVPEPAEWLLMLAGVGAVGMMIRRRQHSSRIAFAA